MEGREGVWGMSRPYSYLSTTFTNGEERSVWPGNKRERSNLHNKPRSSPSHGLCSLGISLARKERPESGRDPEACGDPGDHLLDSTKGISSSQESVITFHSTSILSPIQFAPISNCRFWVQSFLSIWFSLPLATTLCLPKYLTKLSLSSYRKKWIPSPGRTSTIPVIPHPEKLRIISSS